MKNSRFLRTLSIFMCIIMVVMLIPLNVIAAENDARTLTIENNVSFKLAKSSSNLAFDYHVQINGSSSAVEYELFGKNGNSLGMYNTSSDGVLSLKVGEKAVINVRLNDTYEVTREEFLGNVSFDGNYYNPIDQVTFNGVVSDDADYYFSQSGKKVELTEEEYNNATDYGKNTTFKGFEDGGSLSEDYSTIEDVAGQKRNYRNGTLVEASSVSVVKASEKIGFIKLNTYTASCEYNGKTYSHKGYVSSDVSVGMVAAALRTDGVSVIVGEKSADGVWPVYEADEVTVVERTYTKELNIGVYLEFDAVATPALGGTASVTVAYGSRCSNPITVTNEAGTDVDTNYYGIDLEMSKNAVDEEFLISYSTGLGDAKIGNLDLRTVIDLIGSFIGFDISDITEAKTSKIDVEVGEFGVTYTFYGLVKGITYTLTPDISALGYEMPSADSTGITSGSPISFRVGAAGTNVEISNYTNFTAGSGEDNNSENKVVLFEKQTHIQFTKKNLAGEAVEGAEFYMIERDVIADMLKVLATYSTDWRAVYEDAKGLDYSNLSWDIVLEIVNAYFANSGIADDAVLKLPAILKATSDENGLVTFSKSSNILKPVEYLLGDSTVDSAEISKIADTLKKFGIKLPENIDFILSAASGLGKIKFETGMPSGNYILVESKAPDGYYANPIIWTVKVASTASESVEVNDVRIGVVYDVVATLLKNKYGVDVENFVPESFFDKNDEAIINAYEKSETKAKEYIEFIYCELEKYVELPDRDQFTEAVITELKNGRDFVAAVNYALRYADGLFGRTIDADFVIYNIRKNEKAEPAVEDESVITEEETVAEQKDTQPQFAISIKKEAVKEAVNEAVKSGLQSIISKLIKTTFKR